MSKLSYLFYQACIIAPFSVVAADADPQTRVEFVQVPTGSPSDVSSENLVSPFTGKIRGSKVRMRLNADLEGRIVKEFDKNELVSVVGEKGDFYVIEAPSDIKAYIFRSFVLDGIVEVNRVNLRMHPDLESPVLGHLNAGESVNGAPCAENSKWLQIDVPKSVHFYVAKDLVENIGGPEVAVKAKERKTTCLNMLGSAALAAKTELKKAFAEIDIEKLQHSYKKIIHEFGDFPGYIEEARSALASIQENYTQKKIAYLETKAQASLAIDSEEEVSQIKEETLAMNNEEEEERGSSRLTDKMLLWGPIEEGLYLSWAVQHDNRTIEEYYREQQDLATYVSGILEPYVAPMKNKPGDFIVKNGDLPVAYVYSTKVNLSGLVGKKVTLLGVERPNNNFAFPAYFILAKE